MVKTGPFRLFMKCTLFLNEQRNEEMVCQDVAASNRGADEVWEVWTLFCSCYVKEVYIHRMYIQYTWMHIQNAL